MVLKVSASFKQNQLVLVNHEAFTYSMVTAPKFASPKKLLALVIRKVESRAKPTGNVNFDNAALYYIMTTFGCVTVFEFDLEVISESKEKNCCDKRWV
jgi:hypothetical protein